MAPAWVSKLKDLKAESKSKPKQSQTPILPGLHASLSASPDAEECIFFAEPVSLKGGSRTSLSARSGPGRCSTDTDAVFPSSENDEAPHMQPCILSSTGGEAATSNLCRLGSMDSFNHTEAPSHSARCGDFGRKSFALSSCGIMAGPLLFGGKGTMASCVQDDMYDLLDNDTEGSIVLTPNMSDSSFGSKSSSMDSSSTGHRRGCAGEGRQGAVLVLDGDDLSGLGSLECGIQTCVYPEEGPSVGSWQRNSLLKEFHSDGVSYDMEVMSRLSCSDGARKIRSENVDSVGSKEMGTIPRQTRKIRSENVDGAGTEMGAVISRQTSNDAEARRHDLNQLYTVGVAPISARMMCHEGIPSSAPGSSLPRQMEESHICATISDLSSANGHDRWPKRISGSESSLADTCVASPVEGCAAISSFWKEGNSLKRPMFSGVPDSAWEERSAVIAAENPDLVLASRWQESAYSPQNPRSESSANTDQDHDSYPCDGDAMPVYEQPDDMRGLAECARQEHGNAGHHKSMYEAYAQRGRRHRRSSFSAVLPRDLQGVVGDSVALVTMSSNPYEDFRRSMYEMIMDKDLEESMDVEELLYCYLFLNSPEHHELIREVFSDVWSAILMSVR